MRSLNKRDRRKRSGCSLLAIPYLEIQLDTQSILLSSLFYPAPILLLASFSKTAQVSERDGFETEAFIEEGNNRTTFKAIVPSELNLSQHCLSF